MFGVYILHIFVVTKLMKMIIELGKYRVELFKDETYTENSVDNVSYQKVYSMNYDYNPIKIGIRIYENDEIIKSVLVSSNGGGTDINQTSQIVESDRIVICCSDTVFCLSIPNLDLIWKTQGDTSTCFEIFKVRESYIIHGEMEISRLNLNGEIMWQESGVDIFTTAEGINDFEITDRYIKATDWENRIYKFDFNGKLIE